MKNILLNNFLFQNCISYDLIRCKIFSKSYYNNLIKKFARSKRKNYSKKIKIAKILPNNLILSFNIYEETGLFEKIFLDLVNFFRPLFEKTFNRRCCKKNSRLFLVLNFLRKNSNYQELSFKLHISKSTVCKYLKKDIVLIASVLIGKYVKILPQPQIFSFYNQNFIDCTNHNKIRTHPKSCFLF
jgi:hypothetical protein